MLTKYRVHRFDLRMTVDQRKLEQFLNSLEGEIIAITPNVTVTPSSPPAWIPAHHGKGELKEEIK